MKHFLILSSILVSGVVFLPSCFNSKSVSSRPAETEEPAASDPASSIYAFNLRSLGGQAVSMEQFRGKKIIVLNVASKCGYTPQYADWEKYYGDNKDKVVVLGFPSNDFGQQEPGTADEIAAFCEENYHVTFPMFEKIHVKGKGQAPLYKWLTNSAQNGWNNQEPSWNFCKYLIDEKGTLTHFFTKQVTPDNPEFQAAIGL